MARNDWTDAKPWTWEFDENGGYDCMTDSVDIHYEGRFKFGLDLSTYGQKHCGPNDAARPLAESLASRVVDALNSAHVTA